MEAKRRDGAEKGGHLGGNKGKDEGGGPRLAMCENGAHVTTAFSALNPTLNRKPLLPSLPRLALRVALTLPVLPCFHTLSHPRPRPHPVRPHPSRLVTREDGTKELRTDCSHTGHVIALYLATRCEQCGVMFTSVR